MTRVLVCSDTQNSLKHRIIQYLTQELAPLNVECISLFGSSIHKMGRREHYNDLDLCAYTRNLVYTDIVHILNIIKDAGGDFQDKPPRYIADSIIPRIEWLIVIEGVVVDVNLLYYDETFINTASFDPVHDSFDVVLGAMYFHAEVIYGTHPYDSFQSLIMPFYSESLRKYRTIILANRAIKFYNLIKRELEEDNGSLLYYLYKERYYIAKLMFIVHRVYPIDYDRYLYRQLLELEGISKEDAKIISLTNKCPINELAEKFLRAIDIQFDQIYHMEPSLLDTAQRQV